MGRNSGWFRRLLAGKKSKNLPASAESFGLDSAKKAKNKKKWSILGSGSAGGIMATREKEVETRVSCPDSQMDASKHAITVAAAAAAVAEAAVAAAQAAAEVVRLTNNGRWMSGSGGRRLDVAAVIIQSAFRGYLARRALKALKALVKLQALVRGHIVRKQTADVLRRMQALARVQARARASRALSILDSSHSTRRFSLPQHTRCGSNPNISDIEEQVDSSWLEQWMEECSWNDRTIRDSSLQTGYYPHHRRRRSRRDEEIIDKILEVDSCKPDPISLGSKRNPQKPISCQSMGRAPSSSLSSLHFPFEADQAAQAFPARPESNGSSRRRSAAAAAAAALTPRSTDGSTNFFSDHHPKYMAKTESSQAKVRSQSAPRQRLDFQKQGCSKRSFHGCWDPSSSPNKSIVINKGRPGSGSLDRVGSSTRIR